MMLRFQALISPTAGVDGDATENRNQRGLHVRRFPASCLDGSAAMQTIHMHIKKKKRKRRLQLCSPVHWHRDTPILHRGKNATSECTESC